MATEHEQSARSDGSERLQGARKKFKTALLVVAVAVATIVATVILLVFLSQISGALASDEESDALVSDRSLNDSIGAEYVPPAPVVTNDPRDDWQIVSVSYIDIPPGVRIDNIDLRGDERFTPEIVIIEEPNGFKWELSNYDFRTGFYVPGTNELYVTTQADETCTIRKGAIVSGRITQPMVVISLAHNNPTETVQARMMIEGKRRKE